MEMPNPFDNAVMSFVQNHCHNAFTDAVFPSITYLGESGIVWIALAVLLLYFGKKSGWPAHFRGHPPADPAAFWLVLSLWAQLLFLCGGHSGILPRQALGRGGLGFGGADRLFSGVLIGPLSYRRVGRSGAGGTMRYRDRAGLPKNPGGEKGESGREAKIKLLSSAGSVGAGPQWGASVFFSGRVLRVRDMSGGTQPANR